MNRVLSPALLLTSLLAAAPAQALNFWGTRAETDTWMCPSFCTNKSSGPTTGGEFAASAVSDIVDSRGEAHATVSFDPTGGISTPKLGASGVSDVDSPFDQGSGHALAFAVEGYTNVGGTTETYTLDITLTGEIFKPSGSDAFIEVELIAWREANFFFSHDEATLKFEAGATVFDEIDLRIDDDETEQIDGSLTFELAPGESVFIWALLKAEAERNGAYANALGTVTATFEDSTGLMAASVPEPTPALLVIAGLLALAIQRRR